MGKIRLLLHCCCAPCSSATLERLQTEYDADIYYYNPNIEPEAEFRKRAGEEERFVREFRPDGGVRVITAEYDHEAFEAIARGREEMPERGERCYLCYELRMRKTAEYAKAHGYDAFTTSLSISPYKSSRWINEIGERLEKEIGIRFLHSDFKKQNGYRRSIELSREYHLYRQDWCGCVYSRRERERKLEEKNMKNPYLDILPEVAEALKAGKPVVALESTIISHGMPYPQNVETALNVERIIRESGATPATIAIIGGRLKAGLSPDEIEYFGKKGRAIAKASRRDIAALCARGEDGATTVTTTMMIAHMAGIKFFATGGIGGVHRGAEKTMDISADLEELANTPVTVICAGAKAILDLKLTLEYLETHGVPVIGYGTEELPAFYSRHSGLKVDYRMDSAREIAAAFHAQQAMGLKGGMLVTNPIPEEYAMDDQVINAAIDQAVAESVAQGIQGKEITPFLLARVAELTGGDSLDSNIQLVYNNARLASRIAVEFSQMK